MYTFKLHVLHIDYRHYGNFFSQSPRSIYFLLIIVFNLRPVLLVCPIKSHYQYLILPSHRWHSRLKPGHLTVVHVHLLTASDALISINAFCAHLFHLVRECTIRMCSRIYLISFAHPSITQSGQSVNQFVHTMEPFGKSERVRDDERKQLT